MYFWTGSLKGGVFLDVQSLYTPLAHRQALQAVIHFLYGCVVGRAGCVVLDECVLLDVQSLNGCVFLDVQSLYTPLAHREG